MSSETHNEEDLAKVVAIVHSDPYESGGKQVAINRGFRDGIKVGQRFLVFGLGNEIHDPDSGKSLGLLEIVRGKGQVIHVQEKMATIECTDKVVTQLRKRASRANPYRGLGFSQPEEIHDQVKELAFRGVLKGDFAKPI